MRVGSIVQISTIGQQSNGQTAGQTAVQKFTGTKAATTPQKETSQP